MDWREAIKEERAMLRRIVALILSLADLAESACGRSPAVCALLLWILSPAETAVRACVAHSSETPPEQTASDARQDLRQLALRLRQLAGIVESEAEFVFSCPRNTASQSSRAPIGDRLVRLADALKALAIMPLVRAPDTS